jgi:hypothetical protein
MVFLFASMPVMAKVPGGEEQKAGDKAQFTDISNHWAKDTIVKMADKGLIKGVGNGKFLPDVKMKRSEFVSALHKTLEIQINYFKAPDINEFFNDVKNDDWFAAQLYDLATLNIVDDRGKFRPDDQITREEMVHYIVNGYNYKLGTVLEELENSTEFSDDKNIDKKYKKAVNKALKLGFIRGKGKNTFDPKGITTRAEALVVLERLIAELENIKDTIENGEKEPVTVEPGYEKSDKAFKMKLKIINNSKKSITINHTSGQKFDFKLLDDKKEILYTWSMDKMFIMALTETVIEPGKSIEFSDELGMESFGDIISKTKYLKAFIIGTSKDMAINNEGYEKVIESVIVEPGYEKTDKSFKMKLKITNNTDKDITLQTSGQKFDFNLLDEKKEILYTWSMNKRFIMMLMDTVIKSGESIEFGDELDMESSGDMVKKAKYLQAFITGTSNDMTINSEGYLVEIK